MIPKIYYINLDHRVDRKEQILEEMKRMDIPESRIERISAVNTKEFGILGCGLSHKKTLERFMESDEQIAIILEDDFQFVQDKQYTHFLLEYPFQKQVKFDIIMLAGKIKEEKTTDFFFLKKVLDAQTTAGYMITREFAPKLIESLTESTNLLEDWWKKHNEKKHEYCLDIYWKKLQPENNWFVYFPKLGIQRESYSDIEQKVTNYRV